MILCSENNNYFNKKNCGSIFWQKFWFLISLVEEPDIEKSHENQPEGLNSLKNISLQISAFYSIYLFRLVYIFICTYLSILTFLS